MADGSMRRLYRPLVRKHFEAHRQMLLVMGPRQVGKTTLCQSLQESMPSDYTYLNWDNIDHRELLLGGPKQIATVLELDKARSVPPLLVLDEIHKYSDWKNLLKGFFDTYSHTGEVRIVVTGSARLDVYKAGGDSLMGRYFRYRIHPLSCAELLSAEPPQEITRTPARIDDQVWAQLLRFGGFPEPFFKADPRFYENWMQLRTQQLFYEDIRDLTRIQDLKQMELLAAVLCRQVGSLTSYTSLSKKVRVSLETIRRWIDTLTMLYYCFMIRPWSGNVARSLLKEPKIYLWDWSQAPQDGNLEENFVASHLLKACHYWTDRGEGEHELYFLRDKQKREVDFLVTRKGQPWFLVEVKKSAGPLSPHLEYFQRATGAQHAFQLEMAAAYEDVDCFSYTAPIRVPGRTLLSQLI